MVITIEIENYAVKKFLVDQVMSSNFCPDLIFKFGDLIEFPVLKD